MIAELIKKSQQDSRVVMMLTVMAALYLPAAMVASIFNSNLVQTVPLAGEADEPSEYHFQVSSQFWMFPVFTVALMVATLGPLGLWMRYSSGKVPAAKTSP